MIKCWYNILQSKLWLEFLRLIFPNWQKYFPKANVNLAGWNLSNAPFLFCFLYKYLKTPMAFVTWNSFRMKIICLVSHSNLFSPTCWQTSKHCLLTHTWTHILNSSLNSNYHINLITRAELYWQSIYIMTLCTSLPSFSEGILKVLTKSLSPALGLTLKEIIEPHHNMMGLTQHRIHTSAIKSL